MKNFFTKEQLFLYENIIFDLDNTIYDENEYLFACYNAIENNICIKGVSDFLRNQFLAAGRKNLFDLCIQHFKLNANYKPRFLEILRTNHFQKKIPTYNYFIPLVKELLQNKKKIIVVTNGNVEQQKNKIQQIEWNELDENIHFVYANMYKPKPNIDSFIEVQQNFEIDKRKTIFIGDSEVDCEYAKNLDIDFSYIIDCIFFYK